MTFLEIRTPSRLHFGLFGWGSDAPRQFGGLGLMVESPGLTIVAKRAERFEAAGPHTDRILQILNDVSARLEAEGLDVPRIRVECRSAPREHAGLGVGTQLSMAVARAMLEFAGGSQPTAQQLARLTQRGRRSGIGIHGFIEGGLIVDGGRGPGSPIPTRLLQVAFPRDWWVLLIVPQESEGVHGTAEIKAFRDLPPLPRAYTDRMCALVLLGVVAGIREHDLATFSEALTEIQEMVGQAFAPAQGGRFATRETERRVGRMRELGLMGVGQSSWGPTIYGFSLADQSRRETLRNQIAAEFNLPPDSVIWTQGSQGGAECRSG